MQYNCLKYNYLIFRTPLKINSYLNDVLILIVLEDTLRDHRH